MGIVRSSCPAIGHPTSWLMTYRHNHSPLSLDATDRKGAIAGWSPIAE